MPFRKSARIVVTNESKKPCDAFYYYIDWQQLPSLPEDSAYFHAMYRQEFPCVMGTNYLIADIKGRGHYVGTVQSVYLSSPGWFGEGNDFNFLSTAKRSQACAAPARKIIFATAGVSASNPARFTAHRCGKATTRAIAAAPIAGIFPTQSRSRSRCAWKLNTGAARIFPTARPPATSNAMT
jgi:hypothetical protein